MATTDIWRPPSGQHGVSVGPVLQAALDALDTSTAHSASSSTEYYSFKYNFRPESVDATKPGRIDDIQQRSDGQVSFRLEQQTTTAGEERHTFAGLQSQARDIECVLIYDELTGEFTLEKVDCWIDLKYDRAASVTQQGVVVGRPLSPPNTNDSPPTASSNSPPTPQQQTDHFHDNVQTVDTELEAGLVEIVEPPPAPVVKPKPKPRAKAALVPPPPIVTASAKGKGKRLREEVDDGDVNASAAPRPTKKQVSPKRAAAAPPPAPLSVPARPPTPPPPRRASPTHFAPVGKSKFSLDLDEDDDRSAPVAAPAPPPTLQFPRGVLTVEEEPQPLAALPGRVPFSEGLVEDEGDGDGAIDAMFDDMDEEEDGGEDVTEHVEADEDSDAEEDGEADEDEEDEDEFGAELEEALNQPVPGKVPIGLNAFAGGGEDDESDEESDEDSE